MAEGPLNHEHDENQAVVVDAKWHQLTLVAHPHHLLENSTFVEEIDAVMGRMSMESPGWRPTLEWTWYMAVKSLEYLEVQAEVVQTLRGALKMRQLCWGDTVVYVKNAEES